MFITNRILMLLISSTGNLLLHNLNLNILHHHAKMVSGQLELLATNTGQIRSHLERYKGRSDADINLFLQVDCLSFVG